MTRSNTPFLNTSAVFHLPIFAYNYSSNLHQKIFSLLQPFSKFRLHQGRDQRDMESCEEWHCFNLSLLPQRMDSDIRVHNHWFLILQVPKIGVLQVTSSGGNIWNRNSKPSNPPSLIPTTYCQYFHTLLIPSQEFTFLNFILSLSFS